MLSTLQVTGRSWPYRLALAAFCAFFAAPCATAVAAPPLTSTTLEGRVAGQDRYATSAASSRATFVPADTHSVVVVSGEDFPDALSASGLAGAVQGPILLTRASSLPSCTADEIERLDVRTVYVVGGDAAVSPTVHESLSELDGIEAVRVIAGATRWDTAMRVGDEIRDLVGSEPARVYLTRGDDFADALAASALAYSDRAPVVLTMRDYAPGGLWQWLEANSPTETVVVGGSGAVSDHVMAEMNDYAERTVRIGGSDRYWTACWLRYWAESQRDISVFGVASGSDFPDALCAGSAIGARGGVVLLTTPARLHAAADEAIRYQLPWNEWGIFGGESVVSAQVDQSVREALGYFETP